ncbi:hypothetical protein QYM36_004595 [Artemia franciscana]|uniref:Uncharacterized protein n=1 Tax=Artemia franciscana TaxID=6661 RepID=A0AA88LGI6_ARTSF|nr:hypothetical protein QYM36_004595 [Artemia franciscana]
MSAIPILDPSDPEFDRDIASSFLNEIKSKGLKPPLNLDSSSRDYNPTSVIKFLTTLGNLMAKESASVIMGDISGNNITDTPIESNGNKDNMNQRVIGSVMDPLGNIPVLDNAKFIKPFFSQLRRVKTLLGWSDSQVIDAVPLRVTGPLLNFFEDRDSSNIRNLEELEKEMTQAYLPGKTAGKKFRDLAELRQSSRETVYQFYKRVEIATKSYRSGYVGLVGFSNTLDKRKVKTEPSLVKIKPIGRDSKVIPTSVKVVSDVTIFEGNNSRKVSWEFLVVPGLGFDIILGWDMLREIGSNLDFQTNTLTFSSGEENKAQKVIKYLESMTDNLLGTDVVRRCVERDEAGEGADCGRPRDQEVAADMAERSSVHGILTADRAEKSSVPEELAADMAERSSVHGILTADRAEKSSVPEELAADMAERSSVHGILTAERAEKSSVPEELAADMAERSSVHGILTADRAEKSSVPEELAADMAERSSVHGILTADRAEKSSKTKPKHRLLEPVLDQMHTHTSFETRLNGREILTLESPSAKKFKFYNSRPLDGWDRAGILDIYKGVAVSHTFFDTDLGYADDVNMLAESVAEAQAMISDMADKALSTCLQITM